LVGRTDWIVTGPAEGSTKEKLEWEEDWEDEDVNDDEFSKELRQELSRNKMSDE
jgi:DSS1/SEM1 family